jgi:hypothetical protein
MKKRRRLSIAVINALIIAPTAICHAQNETDSARAVRHAKAEVSLAKAAQNPVANMVSLPLQYNFITAGGFGENTARIINVQPVLPLPIGENWLIVSRTVVPFVSIPVVDAVKSHGIGDIQEQAYFTSSKPGKVTWAVGPVLSFPTASALAARTGQWGLGPTAVALVMPGLWVIGTLANNIWRIGGTAHREVLNTFTVQPFINYNLPRAWAISTAPLITSNWSAPSGERWTVPIGLGVSKITHIAEQPLNLLLQYYHNLDHPRRAGSEQIRLEVAALWPTPAAEAAKKKAEAQIAAKKKGEKPQE